MISIEYKREAFAMFEDLMQSVCWEIVHNIFHLNLTHFNHEALEHKREQELRDMQFNVKEDGAPAGVQPQQIKKESEAGRNEPCPCGSGKKYKKCCA